MTTNRPLTEGFRLDGRVAVVIGGTGVLCEMIARGFAAAGAETVLVGRDQVFGEYFLDRWFPVSFRPSRTAGFSPAIYRKSTGPTHQPVSLGNPRSWWEPRCCWHLTLVVLHHVVSLNQTTDWAMQLHLGPLRNAKSYFNFPLKRKE